MITRLPGLLLLCAALGPLSLVLFPPHRDHTGLVLFAMFCVIIPGYAGHFATGYFLKRFELALGGRYLPTRRGWWLETFTLIDRAFAREVRRCIPGDAREAALRAVFLYARASVVPGTAAVLVLANLFPAK